MPLFRCEKCGCVENTAMAEGGYWNKQGEKLCSECHTGKWHDDFEKRSANGFFTGVSGFIYSKEEAVEKLHEMSGDKLVGVIKDGKTITLKNIVDIDGKIVSMSNEKYSLHLLFSYVKDVMRFVDFIDKHLFWKKRPRNHFNSKRGWEKFNNKYAGKIVENQTAKFYYNNKKYSINAVDFESILKLHKIILDKANEGITI